MLVSAGLVTGADVDRAMAQQRQFGGRLGDQLVALGVIAQAALDEFITTIPAEPETIADTGIPATELLNLLIKQIHMGRLETPADFVDAIKLPPRMVEELVQAAVLRKLLAALGGIGTGMRYELSEEGKRWAVEALKTSLYTGPAPVPLAEFCARIHRQKITNDDVTFETIRGALRGYSISDDFIRKIGPALNAGRAMLLYGPPGNGKTTIARSFADVFNSVIYVPHAVYIEGQIMRVFDPSFHFPIAPAAPMSVFSGLRRESYDARWVAVRRPFIVTGGELTLEMLDLSYDMATGFYEAPLHIKAQGGCFVVDDFGRQIVAPATLLNRWIVPMESRVDYLKLHTGKSFSIPFEALVIFSTNIDPEDLMDPAFLRRIPYKIEVGGPDKETYFSIFEALCARRGVAFDKGVFEVLIEKVTGEKKLELAAFHAAFIVDQVVAIGRFLGKRPELDVESIDYALGNLKTKGRKG
jgi:energy-coupling factor transporter ATP-binding protein EcfA2